MLFDDPHGASKTSQQVVAGISSFYRNKKHVDCKFIVGEDRIEFKAHKLILSAGSSVFEDQLYSEASVEPILVPDVDPKAFRGILKYIYLNVSPPDDALSDKNLIDIWYAASKYQLHDLAENVYNLIKIHLSNWHMVFIACETMSLNGLVDKNVEKFMLICRKVFSVKTTEAVRAINDIPSRFLLTIFSLDGMNIDNEMELFKALVDYANNNGWTPAKGYYTEAEKKNDTDNKNREGLGNMQKHIRDAMKQIRFLSMTLKEFDKIPANSGFFTETEVKAIRDRIIDDKSPCISKLGFSTNTSKTRYERLELNFFENNTDSIKRDLQQLSFTVTCPSDHMLGVTDLFEINGFKWKIIIFHISKNLGNEHTVYLKCNGPATHDSDIWKCYAQMDVRIGYKEKSSFANIPWFCFQSKANYSRIRPIKLSVKKNIPLVCVCHLSLSTHHVSYKNCKSKVTPTYGKEPRYFE